MSKYQRYVYGALAEKNSEPEQPYENAGGGDGDAGAGDPFAPGGSPGSRHAVSRGATAADEASAPGSGAGSGGAQPDRGDGERGRPAWRVGARRRDGGPAQAIIDTADELLNREMTMRKARNKVRRKYVLMVFVLFVFAVALIYRYSLVIEINSGITRQARALAAIDTENSVLQKQIGMETDLEKIRLLAESRLNMHKPDKYQIVYIKVPKRDHALMEVGAAEEESKTLIEGIGEQIQLIRERLFEK
jgi:cell division protein FtsL